MLFATYHNHKNTKRSKIRKTSVFSRISLTLQQICKTRDLSVFSRISLTLQQICKTRDLSVYKIRVQGRQGNNSKKLPTGLILGISGHIKHDKKKKKYI